jgi:hypothetical protein
VRDGAWQQQQQRRQVAGYIAAAAEDTVHYTHCDTDATAETWMQTAARTSLTLLQHR